MLWSVWQPYRYNNNNIMVLRTRAYTAWARARVRVTLWRNVVHRLISPSSDFRADSSPLAPAGGRRCSASLCRNNNNNYYYYHCYHTRSDNACCTRLLRVPLPGAVSAVAMGGTARKYRFDRTARPEIPDFGSTKSAPTRHGLTSAPFANARGFLRRVG